MATITDLQSAGRSANWMPSDLIIELNNLKQSKMKFISIDAASIEPLGRLRASLRKWGVSTGSDSFSYRTVCIHLKLLSSSLSGDAFLSLCVAWKHHCKHSGSGLVLFVCWTVSITAPLSHSYEPDNGRVPKNNQCSGIKALISLQQLIKILP